MKTMTDGPKDDNIPLNPTKIITIDYLVVVLVVWYDQMLKNKFKFLLFFINSMNSGFKNVGSSKNLKSDN